MLVALPFTAPRVSTTNASAWLALRGYDLDLHQHRRVYQVANDKCGRRAYLAHHFQEDRAISGHVVAVDDIAGDLDHVGPGHSGLREQGLDARPRRPRLYVEVAGYVAGLTGDVEYGTSNLN